MSRAHDCALAVMLFLGGGSSWAGILANTDPVPEGLDAEIKVEHPTDSTEVRCYLAKPTSNQDSPPCVIAVTSTLTLIFVGFWQDRETTVRITEPGGAVREVQAINGALFKQLMIPGKPLGLYRVTATQRGGSRNGGFVLKGAERPMVSVLKSNFDAGDTVRYMLSGFAPSRPISLFAYRANGITSYSGVGSSYFDYVTELTPAVADVLGNAIVTIATDENDPGGGYLLITDPQSSRDDAASNQFWLSGGQRAPTPRRYANVIPEEGLTRDTSIPGKPRGTAEESMASTIVLRAVDSRTADSTIAESEGVGQPSTSSAVAGGGEHLKLALTYALMFYGDRNWSTSVQTNSSRRNGASSTRISAQSDSHKELGFAPPGADAARGPLVITEADLALAGEVAKSTAIERQLLTSVDTIDARRARRSNCGSATVIGVAALSLRAEPSLTARKLGEAEEGVSVEILCGGRATISGRVWVRVRDSSDVSGWMSEKYLIR